MIKLALFALFCLQAALAFNYTYNSPPGWDTIDGDDGAWITSTVQPGIVDFAVTEKGFQCDKDLLYAMNFKFFMGSKVVYVDFC